MELLTLNPVSVAASFYFFAFISIGAVDFNANIILPIMGKIDDFHFA